MLAVVFVAFLVIGGGLLVAGVNDVSSRRREGAVWMVLGALVIAMGATIVIAV